jgi:8-oxo-dGTP diphosphatase
MIDVSCAIIHNDKSEILIVQRGEHTDHPFKWEFPGGKIKDNESFEDSIIREIDEELSMDIIITGDLPPVEYDYGLKKVRLFPALCDTLDDYPELREHLAYKWIKAHELDEVDLCEADILVATEYRKRYAQGPAVKTGNEAGMSGEDKNKIREMLSGKGGYAACDVLADNIIKDSSMLGLMVDYSLSGDKTLAFRASYCIVKAEEKVPGIAEQYYGLFTESLPGLDHESAIRAFLKILNAYDLARMDEDHHGILAGCCFAWLAGTDSSIAVKVYSMNLLYMLSSIYPELTGELRESILAVIEEGSAGIKARGRQILKLLPG